MNLLNMFKVNNKTMSSKQNPTPGIVNRNFALFDSNQLRLKLCKFFYCQQRNSIFHFTLYFHIILYNKLFIFCLFLVEIISVF